MEEIFCSLILHGTRNDDSQYFMEFDKFIKTSSGKKGKEKEVLPFLMIFFLRFLDVSMRFFDAASF